MDAQPERTLTDNTNPTNNDLIPIFWISLFILNVVIVLIRDSVRTKHLIAPHLYLLLCQSASKYVHLLAFSSSQLGGLEYLSSVTLRPIERILSLMRFLTREG